ncbi:MAG: hypothetical protein GF403_03905 [Candidatus Coatesbacteria bacterium]|nr:hypothetical protein [Candidatus Coatesbacteria bacterium]
MLKALIKTLALTAALLLITGCGEPTDTTDEVDYPTADSLIAALETTYDHLDLESYGGLFDEDTGFTFHFDDDDVDAGLPESWDLEAELDAAASLFTTIDPASFQFSLEDTDIEEPEEDTATLNNIDYDLRLVSDAELIVAQGRINLTIERIDGDWRIVECWDEYYPVTAGLQQSWGAFKYDNR